MFPRLWRLLRPFHPTFYTLVGLAVFYEISSLVSSYTISLIVQMFQMQVQLFIWLLVLGAAILHGEMGMRLDNKFDWHIIAEQSHEIYPYLSIKAVGKFLKLPASWHQKVNSGSMNGQIRDAIWKAMEVIDVTSWEIITTSGQIVISIFPILFFSPIIGIILMIVFLIFIKITLNGEKKKYSLRKKRQSFYNKDWGYGSEIIRGWEPVVLFNQQDYVMSAFKKIQDRIKSLALQEHKIGIYQYNRMRIRLNVNARLAFYVILAIQLYYHTIDVPNLIFISVLIERLLSNFWRFTRLIDRIYSNSQSINQLLNLLDQKEVSPGGTITKPRSLPVGIEFKNVCFNYKGAGRGTLHRLNLKINAGEVTALVGPSGAGKTTIPRMILNLWDKLKGEILIGGEPIENWNKASLRSLISYVPQGNAVFIWDTTIGKNISFPNPKAPFEKTVYAAKMAGIHDFIMTLPKGYNTRVGEHGQMLSGGQMQRVALARAIFADSPVLILDEATSAVDPITESEIQEKLFETVFKNRTILVIAHRLSTIRNADKIIVLQNGRKVEEGTHESLLLHPGLYAKMVATQTK